MRIAQVSPLHESVPPKLYLKRYKDDVVVATAT
jgi:hypothetical protein